MTRITNVDQVLLLIRQQLQRLSTGSGAPARKARNVQNGPRQTALGRLSALNRLQDLPETDLENSLVRALLTDEFGDRLANDPRFLRVAGEVSRIIAGDEEARDLLRQAVRRIRENAR